ncbi:PREDICTED: 4-coumarate--CoA ligase-like 5 isoform X2 [Populus euphratica]|uniref:4-coumarate--CoA ligase-like 5 isoform X2 n=1 Tax=Populus euphratica TaxID=75702 RepID=A0AAJ6U801_POPEU|nr:PREDICTED: 4-coumarate--CoA ligase-like 5 isoform X2 [Populus euphratica]
MQQMVQGIFNSFPNFIKMPAEELWTSIITKKEADDAQSKSGFDPKTGIYHSLHQLGENLQIPTRHDLDTTSYVLSQFPHPDHAETKVALVDLATNQQVTYAQLHRSIHALASGLYNGLGVRKGDVVFLLSPNSILYPTICLAVFSIGAILSPANPANTVSEILKQIRDSGAKLVISAPEELHKLVENGVPTLVTTRESNDDSLSVKELIECSGPLELPQVRITQSDTAAILYSSGTTGTSKGVILTHSNFVAIMTLLKWSVYASSSQNDIFLCFVPIFHIYGLAFFGLGLFCAGITTVLMQRFDFQAMLDAVQAYKINNIPAVPPVILGLVKRANKVECDLSSLRRVGSGAAPLSKELSDEFRQRFPWVELRQGYGLTESSGATTFFISDEQAKAHPASCGRLVPTFSAKIVDTETGSALPPGRKGELLLKSPTIMKGYLGNEAATAATFDPDGWLKTGDIGYFDEDGFLHIVDRIKELIKHNGYQVAPAELEAILLGHPQVLDAAVVPVEDEEAGQIPMAYVVRTAGSELTEEQVIQFVANQPHTRKYEEWVSSAPFQSLLQAKS